MVMIGLDPAKHSHAMAVLDGAERQLAALQVANDNDGYQGKLRLARRWPQRTWAVEGASGVGTHLAQRLLAGGEMVLRFTVCVLVRTSSRRRSVISFNATASPSGWTSRNPDVLSPTTAMVRASVGSFFRP